MKTLGGENFFKKKFSPPKPPSFKKLSHHAPSNERSDFDLHVGRSAVGISFLGGFYFLSLIASYRKSGIILNGSAVLTAKNVYL